MKRYVTFGQDHRHEIDGKIFDKDCVAVVTGTRDDVFRIFGSKFSLEYPEDYWDEGKLSYFPRGYIEVKNAN